jgi:hypothetical protein
VPAVFLVLVPVQDPLQCWTGAVAVPVVWQFPDQLNGVGAVEVAEVLGGLVFTPVQL